MRALAAIGWAYPVLAGITLIVVGALTVDLMFHIAKYGIYDGSRAKCLGHATNVVDIQQCNLQPFD